ncbi:MAG: hypothetical protein ACK40K_06675, partial [Raineya sp.]
MTPDKVTIKNILNAISPISEQTATQLISATQIRTFEKGEMLETDGQKIKYQFVVMRGIVRKFLTNPKGEEFTIDFFTANQAITPALLRSVDFLSF